MSERKDIAAKDQNVVEKTRVLKTAVPSVDIYENENEILLQADMPGVKKEDISINIDNGRLTLTGVRQKEQKGVSTWEEFAGVEYVRVFSIPQSIDITEVKAELKDGVLSLHLPKSEAAKPRTIEIKAA